MSADSPGSGPWEVPAHEARELRARASRYCVVIPVIDEGERILAQLRRMREQSLPDVILADGGSRDGSTEPERLRELGVRTLLVKTGPGKLGAQLRMGFAYALGQGYEGVVLVDGNGKDDTAAIHDFVRELDAGWDYVQGSRFVRGGAAVRNPAWRLAAIRAVHAPAISLAAGFRYTDTTNGFRACSARLLRDDRVALFRDALSGYELHYYLSIRAARLGFRVKEIPVRREYPASGPLPSKISFVRGNLRVLRALALACLGRYDPPREGAR